jgi:fucose permease
METQAKTNTAPKIGLILLVFMAFVALGMPDGLLGVAWPSIRADFGQALDALTPFMFAATAGYLVSAFFSGKIISKMGVGWVLAASCALTGLGLLCYSIISAMWMMVLLGVIGGLGAGTIDAGLNTYVASNFQERQMQWLHACYGIGVTLGPIIMTAGLNYFQSWRLGYVVVGVAQLLLAGSFVSSIKMWKSQKSSDEGETKKLTDYDTSLRRTLRKPMVWLSFLLFFVYTGCEISLGVWVYSLLTESRGVAPAIAGLMTGSYWISFTIGRILAGFYAKHMKTRTILFMAMFSALAGSLLLMLNINNTISVVGVGLIGFAIAPIFPAMVSDTSSRVGDKYAANTIGIQLAGAGLGGAVISSTIGILAARFSLEAIPWAMVVNFTILIVLFVVSLTARKPASPAPALK